MNITIKATGTTLTPAIEEVIEQKLQALAKLLKDDDLVAVEIDERDQKNTSESSRVEIHIRPHGYYADATGHDFYEALDAVQLKIRDQVVKNKDKRLSFRKRLGARLKGFWS